MWKRVLVVALAGVLLLAGGGFAYLWLRQPAQAPPLAIQVAMTPERVERGRYIFEHLSDCGGCHSPRDFSRFNGPAVAGK